MDDEAVLKRLDDWSLEDEETPDRNDIKDPIHTSPFDTTAGVYGNATEYLELSDDSSAVAEIPGGIDSFGFTDESDLLAPDTIPDIPDLDMNPWDGLPYSSQYYDLLAVREKLPVWQTKDDFILSLDESPIILVTGRAGTGKSTQIPQWCAHYAKELNFEHGAVVCTQPHSLAAASLALQVSKEMDLTTGIGNEVGYTIPFSDLTSQDTILKFCKDTELLREMAEDPLLERYGIVVVDEVQERTVSTDVLLSLLKMISSRRNNLKIVVISLPHEMPKLEEYFEGVPVVDLSYVEDNQDGNKETLAQASPESSKSKRNPRLHFKRSNELHCDYIWDAAETILKCHCDQSLGGNILAFMPGSQDILEVCERVARGAAMRVLRGEAGDLATVPLFASLPYGSQQAAYENTSKNLTSESGLHCRRVIVCDKMAESSFTIEDVAFVVDTGREMSKAYNCRTRSRSDILCYTTKRNAELRYKRCKEDGHVYRLYSKADYQRFRDALPPAVTRSELSTDVLLMKRLLQQLDERFSSCQTIDPPAPDEYMQALEDLDYHGALDESGDLSDLGAVMSEFPVALPIAKSIIASCGEQCTEEMLAIAAMLAAPPCFVHNNDSSSSISSKRRVLNHPAGDHFTLLRIYAAFAASKHSEHWCKENGFDYEALKFACKIRQELAAVMERLELPLSPAIKNEDLLLASVKKALLAGFFMQVAKDVDGGGNYLLIRDRQVSRLSKTTSLRGYPDWVLYHDFVLSDTNSIVTVTSIPAEMVAEISPASYLANLPSGEAKDALLQAVDKLKYKAGGPHHQYKEGLSPESSHTSETTPSSTSTNTDESYRDSKFLPTSSNSTGGDQKHTVSKVQTERSQVVNHADVADPMSDLIGATARELSNAYRQASDYVRNLSVEEENDQEGCALQ